MNNLEKIQCFPCYALSSEFVKLDEERSEYLNKMSETKPEVEHGYHFDPCRTVAPNFCEGEEECIKWRDQADRIASVLMEKKMCSSRIYFPCSLKEFKTRIYFSDAILCCTREKIYKSELEKKIAESHRKIL